MIQKFLKSVLASHFTASIPIFISLYFAFSAAAFVPVTISPEAYGFCRNPQTAPFAAMCANLLENDPFTPSKGKHVGAALAFLLLSGLWHVGVFSSRISAECSSSRELEKTASSDQKAA